MEATQHGYEESNDLEVLLAKQTRQIAELRSTLRDFRDDRHGVAGADESRELGYRFDAGPKWVEGSGWKSQSPEHRKAWPVLRRLLELERWPGAPVRITYAQLADYLCCSEDTAKRRLRELAGHEKTADLGGVVELKPGSGRRPSIVRIKHPIATPLKYDEVPWAVGGLGEGTPDGYLEGLRGPKRRYAELYGVNIPKPRPVPDQENGMASEGLCPNEQVPPLLEEPPKEGAQATSPGPAPCAPLETRENCIIRRSSPSDTGAQAGIPQQGRKDRKKNPAQKMEQDAAKITVPEISEGAVVDARMICEALGRQDEITAHRAAQVAELLRQRDRAHLLSEVLGRIRRTIAGGNLVHKPGAYLCATVLDVERSSPGSEGRRLANRVLAHTPKPATPSGTENSGVADFKRGYEWLFGE